jgi:tetratricopeptide (TPR) repeat protein
MKKITIIALSFLLFASGFSQAQKVKYPTRKGIVQEATMIMDKNGKPKKKPLAGVRIFTGKGVSDSSNAKGEFTLKPDAVPFKITQVKKKEYTLLSPEQGTRTYQDNNEILDVLMVSTKTLNNYMDSQMEIARLKREEKKKQALEEIEQQKADGKITYGEYFQKQDSINDAYDEQMKRLVEFVERSCKEFFKGMERIDKEIDECIMKGEYDKADSLLLSKGYFNKRIENIEKLEQVTEQLVKDAVSDCWKYYEINRDKIKYDEALAYLDTARVLQEKHFGLQDPDLALTYNSMGFVYSEQGNLDKAMEFINKALQIREQVLNPLSPDLAVSYSNIGAVYKSKGDYDKAMEFLNKALQIREQVLNPLSPALAVSYNNIGAVYKLKGDYDKAMEFYDKALKIREQVLNPLSPALATSYSNIGGVYNSQKNYDKALKIFEQVLNPLSPALATSYSNIGLVYDAQGNYDKAMEFYNKALQIKEQVLNPLSPSLATSYNNIGVVYFEMENYDKALEYFNKALPGCIKNFGEENDDTIFVKQMIEQCKQALGE